jgi:hypothetical protein
MTCHEGGGGVELFAFLTLAPFRGGCLKLRRSPFYPQPGYPVHRMLRLPRGRSGRERKISPAPGLDS